MKVKTFLKGSVVLSRLHDSVDDLGILVERDGLNDMTWLESNDGSGTPQALGLNLSTPELEMFFKRMDYNGDGSVQLPELVHFLEGSMESPWRV